MTPVHDLAPQIIRFVEVGLFGPGKRFGAASALGWADDSGLVAGFVFHNYEPENGVIEVSGYSTRRNWASPAIVRTLFGYPFDQLGCRMVVARHSEHNRRVRRIWRALGASEYLIPDLRGPGEAECISTLLALDWRKSKFNL